jgi:hypothetical protein
LAYVFPSTALCVGLLCAGLVFLIHRDHRAFRTDVIASLAGSFYMAMTARDLGVGYHELSLHFMLALVVCMVGSAAGLFIVYMARTAGRSVARLFQGSRK